MRRRAAAALGPTGVATVLRLAPSRLDRQGARVDAPTLAPKPKPLALTPTLAPPDPHQVIDDPAALPGPPGSPPPPSPPPSPGGSDDELPLACFGEPDPHEATRVPVNINIGRHERRTRACSHYTRPLFAVHIAALENALDIDTRAQAPFLRMLWRHCYGYGVDDLFGAEVDDPIDDEILADAVLLRSGHMPEDHPRRERAITVNMAFERVFRNMHMGWGEWEEPLSAIHALAVWLCAHRVDGLEAMLDADLFNVGDWLFNNMGDVQPRTVSLLAIAAIDACSPEAVALLLSRGACPHANVPYEDLCASKEAAGMEGLANLDVAGLWCGSECAKMRILCLFSEHGGYALGAETIYHDAGNMNASYKCKALFQDQLDRASDTARARWHGVMARVAIVSFWRRAAAAPDSKAAKAAIARVAKRARLQELPPPPAPSPPPFGSPSEPGDSTAEVRVRRRHTLTLTLTLTHDPLTLTPDPNPQPGDQRPRRPARPARLAAALAAALGGWQRQRRQRGGRGSGSRGTKRFVGPVEK